MKQEFLDSGAFMPTINDKMNLCTTAFEEISQALKSKMTEIVNLLTKDPTETDDDFPVRLSTVAESLEKLKILLAENIKHAQALKTHINALDARIPKRGKMGPNSMPQPPVEKKVRPRNLNFSPPPERPEPKAPKETSLLPPPEPDAKLSPIPEKPALRLPPTNNLPIDQDQIQQCSEILLNLSNEVNALTSSEEIGKAILRTKDQLAAQIKVHPALFDLIKYGNDYIRKKPAVNTAFIRDVQQKLAEIERKISGL